jgi:hypothetical protein
LGTRIRISALYPIGFTKVKSLWILYGSSKERAQMAGMTASVGERRVGGGSNTTLKERVF